jgi:hypothetical protein
MDSLNCPTVATFMVNIQDKLQDNIGTSMKAVCLCELKAADDEMQIYNNDTQHAIRDL